MENTFVYYKTNSFILLSLNVYNMWPVFYSLTHTIIVFLTIKNIMLFQVLFNLFSFNENKTSTPCLIFHFKLLTAEIAFGLVLYSIPCQCRALAWPFIVIKENVFR